MKILIVSFGFPPSNVIGAVRVGKLTRYLDRRGHDVRVLTASGDGDKSLPLEIQPQRVLYTEYRTGRNWRNSLAQPFRSGQAVQAANISRPSLGDSGAQGSSPRIFYAANTTVSPTSPTCELTGLEPPFLQVED